MMASGILLGGIMLHKRVKSPPFHDNLAQLKKSFDKILSQEGTTYYLGHGKAVNRSQVTTFYDKYLKTSDNF